MPRRDEPDGGRRSGVLKIKWIYFCLRNVQGGEVQCGDWEILNRSAIISNQ